MSAGPQTWVPTVIQRLSRVPAVVRVVVAQVQGSTPREPGAYMLVDAAGSTGTIGGGRLEWEALEAAREMLQQGTRGARLMNRVLGIDLGQCCGGVIAVWLECFPQDCLAQLRALEPCLAEGPVVLATAASAKGVQHTISRGSAADATAAALLDLPRARAAPQVRRTAEGEITFVERLDEEYPAVWLFGAGHVGQALAGMLLQLPLRLLWQDSRPGQLPAAAAEYSRMLPAAALVRAVAEAAPGTHFLVMTHDHALDYELCRAVLMRADAAWLGLIGSQSKAARFRSRLRRDGFGAPIIEQLTCPIGVTGIKSKWPAAIAVAIAAQLMQILSQPAAEAADAVAGSGPIAPCTAGECAQCGRHEPLTQGTVVTQT
ncbi:MAG TPA: xanthine dehydrogenase accessory protein XdhC [Steroidobacteraceae bacterium]|jgi:xanthine dehydrogenase accessory factor|nr:xanthine dehydrogenase accessory protein XdhC [Steroidobacteraceae bacterium]